MTRMEKKRAALQEQVRLAVSVLETVHEGHALQQHRLSQLETKMHERTEPVSCKKFATLQGEELLDALQAAVNHIVAKCAIRENLLKSTNSVDEMLRLIEPDFGHMWAWDMRPAVLDEAKKLWGFK